jgi:hypothetical protein
MITTAYRQADTRPLRRAELWPIMAHLPATDQDAIRWRVSSGLGPSTAFLIDGQAMAAGGLTMCHAGMADPWLVITPAGRAHFRPLYRAMVAWLAAQIETLRLHRLQAAVRHDDVKAIRLLQHLAFAREGIARQFGPDRADYYWYAWTRKE